MIALGLAVALLPVGPIGEGTCAPRAQFGDVLPQGAGRTFQARHTIVIHDFALMKWYAGQTGGGEAVLKRRGNDWCVVPFHGTYLDQAAYVGLGVPAADAREFRRQAAEYLQAIATVRRREPSSHPNDMKDPDD
jgi:hypothetical protein